MRGHQRHGDGSVLDRDVLAVGQPRRGDAQGMSRVPGESAEQGADFASWLAESGQSVDDPRALAEELVQSLRMTVPHDLHQSGELIDAVQVILHEKDRP